MWTLSLCVWVSFLLFDGSAGQKCLPGQEKCGLTCCAVNSGYTCCQADGEDDHKGCAPPGAQCCWPTPLGYCNVGESCCDFQFPSKPVCKPNTSICCESDERGFCDPTTQQCCSSDGGGCQPKSALCCGASSCEPPLQCCGGKCYHPKNQTCCGDHSGGFICNGVNQPCDCGICYNNKTSQCCAYGQLCDGGTQCCGSSESGHPICCSNTTVCCPKVTLKGEIIMSAPGVCADPKKEFCCQFYDGSSALLSIACPLGTLCCQSQYNSPYSNDGCCLGHLAVNSTCSGTYDSCPYN